MGSLVNWNCQQFKRITHTILILVLFFFSVPLKSNAEGDPALINKVTTVVIDAGHGGNDPGAIGSRAKEKDITLGIALKLGKYIRENFADVKVIYTRDRDIFIPLFERAEIANKNKADLFISIHANANVKKYVYGSETYVMGEDKNEMNFEVAKAENSVILLEDDYSTTYEGFDPNSTESYIIFSLMQRTHLNQSLNIADKIQHQFKDKARREDRGVKQAGFLVLWRTSMPSVLIESGFITHPDEEKYLISELGQDYLASAIFRAFKEYKMEIENSSAFTTQLNKENPENSKEDSKPNMHNVYYKLQLFSSKTQIKLDDIAFSGYANPEEFNSGNWYKYAIGNYATYIEASNDLQKVRDKYSDAFIIAIQNRKIIPLDEAKELSHK